MVEAEFKLLDISYIDEVMKLQNLISKSIENKEIFAVTSREEFEEYFLENGKILGCVTKEKSKLIAIGVLVRFGYNKENYGYDLGIEGEKLLKIGQIDTVAVLEEYRGNKLQYLLIKYLEELAQSMGINIMCATVSPYNKYSLYTFEKLGYQVKKDKLKYGGLRRYILSKEL